MKFVPPTRTFGTEPVMITVSCDLKLSFFIRKLSILSSDERSIFLSNLNVIGKTALYNLIALQIFKSGQQARIGTDGLLSDKNTGVNPLPVRATIAFMLGTFLIMSESAMPIAIA